MILSQVTIDGLRMTGISFSHTNKYIIHNVIHVCDFLLFLVTSFLKVGPTLLASNGVKFLLTEQFSQDPTESYFGNQRSRDTETRTPTNSSSEQLQTFYASVVGY